MRSSKLIAYAGSVAVCGCFIALWQYGADRQWVSAIFLPGPNVVWHSLTKGLVHTDLGTQVLRTTGRMVYGWALASLVGIALGAMIGISPTARRYIAPSIEMVRPLPASAMVPVAIALFGLTDRMVLAVIAFGGLWPMLLATVYGFGAVEPRLLELSRALGLTRLQIVLKVALPSALPDIFTGLRLSLTTALVLAVVGEMLASRPGIGQWIQLAGRSFRAGDLYAGVAVLGVLGFVSASLLAAVEHRVLRWRRSG